MRQYFHKVFRRLPIFAAAIFCCMQIPVSCVKDPLCEISTMPDRIDKVLLIYAAGKNNLASDIRTNIEDFCKGYVPAGDCPDILLTYENLSGSTSPTESYLIRIYSHYGNTVRDTLKTFPAGTHAAESSTLEEILNLVRDRFPAEGYGLLFSSHANGWLPKGYYSNPSHYDRQMTGRKEKTTGQVHGHNAAWVPYVEPVYDPSSPPVKSIGQDRVSEDGQTVSYEMDLQEFSEAIPMHLDYIFFDCCLMGGIEVAYELKDKCDRIIFSPAEVLSTGFDYSTMAVQLLGEAGPDLEGVCRDYYNRYNAMSGQWKSATVTLIDCTRLEPLAEACRLIISNHMDQLALLDGSGIQQFFQADYHWFYDLRDIIVHSGASGMELDLLDSTLDNCIIYKAATDRFISFPINTYSGLSMYLPGNGSDYLDGFYRSLAWNRATGLVPDTQTSGKAGNP